MSNWTFEKFEANIVDDFQIFIKPAFVIYTWKLFQLNFQVITSFMKFLNYENCFGEWKLLILSFFPIPKNTYGIKEDNLHSWNAVKLFYFRLYLR